jgi:hypothetical protein
MSSCRQILDIRRRKASTVAFLLTVVLKTYLLEFEEIVDKTSGTVGK